MHLSNISIILIPPCLPPLHHPLHIPSLHLHCPCPKTIDLINISIIIIPQCYKVIVPYNPPLLLMQLPPNIQCRPHLLLPLLLCQTTLHQQGAFSTVVMGVFPSHHQQLLYRWCRKRLSTPIRLPPFYTVGPRFPHHHQLLYRWCRLRSSMPILLFHKVGPGFPPHQQQSLCRKRSTDIIPLVQKVGPRLPPLQQMLFLWCRERSTDFIPLLHTLGNRFPPHRQQSSQSHKQSPSFPHHHHHQLLLCLWCPKRWAKEVALLLHKEMPRFPQKKGGSFKVALLHKERLRPLHQFCL
mmetsp:Transcript_41885/g.69701  ORF Transcript_41885/g.69701 Transcript_41885/m.69701 type:complete len:295 (-) Transcript_41885:2979-3863(-)